MAHNANVPKYSVVVLIDGEIRDKEERNSKEKANSFFDARYSEYRGHEHIMSSHDSSCYDFVIHGNALQGDLVCERVALCIGDTSEFVIALLRHCSNTTGFDVNVVMNDVNGLIVKKITQVLTAIVGVVNDVEGQFVGVFKSRYDNMEYTSQPMTYDEAIAWCNDIRERKNNLARRSDTITLPAVVMSNGVVAESYDIDGWFVEQLHVRPVTV